MKKILSFVIATMILCSANGFADKTTCYAKFSGYGGHVESDNYFNNLRFRDGQDPRIQEPPHDVYINIIEGTLPLTKVSGIEYLTTFHPRPSEFRLKVNNRTECLIQVGKTFVNSLRSRKKLHRPYYYAEVIYRRPLPNDKHKIFYKKREHYTFDLNGLIENKLVDADTLSFQEESVEENLFSDYKYMRTDSKNPVGNTYAWAFLLLPEDESEDEWGNYYYRKLMERDWRTKQDRKGKVYSQSKNATLFLHPRSWTYKKEIREIAKQMINHPANEGKKAWVVIDDSRFRNSRFFVYRD